MPMRWGEKLNTREAKVASLLKERCGLVPAAGPEGENASILELPEGGGVPS